MKAGLYFAFAKVEKGLDSGLESTDAEDKGDGLRLSKGTGKRAAVGASIFCIASIFAYKVKSICISPYDCTNLKRFCL
ncbi:hypothetical protein [Paenibacillus sp. Z6-24]